MSDLKIGKFLRIFVLFVLIILIVINWGTIKGIFNYKAIYGDIVNSLKQQLFKEKEVVLKVPDVKLSEPKFTEKSDSVEVPKIEILTPLIFIESSENKDITAGLEKGVVHYSQSVLPGENGQTVILGHSAPSGWPKIKYDWVFSRLNDLNPGDEIFVNYQNRQYRYLVSEKYFLEAGEEIPSVGLTNSGNVLILISCWPPGANIKRIAVEAELVK